MGELSTEHRRALGLINAGGVSTDLLRAHGYPSRLINELVRAGLATRSVQAAGRQHIKMTMLNITDAGRVALERK